MVKALRFQIKGEDEQETDMVFMENPSYTRGGRSDSWRPSEQRLSRWRRLEACDFWQQEVADLFRLQISNFRTGVVLWALVRINKTHQSQLSLNLVSKQKGKK